MIPSQGFLLVNQGGLSVHMGARVRGCYTWPIKPVVTGTGLRALLVIYYIQTTISPRALRLFLTSTTQHNERMEPFGTLLRKYIYA